MNTTNHLELDLKQLNQLLLENILNRRNPNVHKDDVEKRIKSLENQLRTSLLSQLTTANAPTEKSMRELVMEIFK